MALDIGRWPLASKGFSTPTNPSLEGIARTRWSLQALRICETTNYRNNTNSLAANLCLYAFRTPGGTSTLQTPYRLCNIEIIKALFIEQFPFRKWSQSTNNCSLKYFSYVFNIIFFVRCTGVFEMKTHFWASPRVGSSCLLSCSRPSGVRLRLLRLWLSKSPLDFSSYWTFLHTGEFLHATHRQY